MIKWLLNISPHRTLPCEYVRKLAKAINEIYHIIYLYKIKFNEYSQPHLCLDVPVLRSFAKSQELVQSNVFIHSQKNVS